MSQLPAVRAESWRDNVPRESLVTTHQTFRLMPLFFFLLAAPISATADQWPNNAVSGTVTFKGAPLAGVTVTAYNTNTSSITQVVTTGKDGTYRLQIPAWIDTAGDGADYHIWAIKRGYAFYPSAPAGATVTRADHTGDFAGNGIDDVPIYFTVVHYVSLPDRNNRGVAGPPLTGVNFIAYDGSNPPLRPTADLASRKRGPWTPRFTDNRNGSVTDELTGLVWLKDAGCLGAEIWDTALKHANALAAGTCGLSDGSVAGDWRLPNINELESIVDIFASNPALTPANPFINVSHAIYWSSTSYFHGQAGSPSAWAIRLADGRFINDWVANDKATAYNRVWAVKSTAGAKLQSTGEYVEFSPGDDGHIQAGVPLTFPRWIDKGDGTVADTVTGLVWLKQANCIVGTWQNAITAIAALASGTCGLTDGSAAGAWRLPTRAEMESLSDRMQTNHADFFNHTFLNRDKSVFQPAIFTGFMSGQYYWTATIDAADRASVWTVYSCDFGVYDAPRDSISYALPLRSGSAAPDPMHGER